MKKKGQEEKGSYRVKLRCRNCNEEWIQDMETGTYVRYEKNNNYMIRRDDKQKKKKRFTCPKCGAHTKIARLPLY